MFLEKETPMALKLPSFEREGLKLVGFHGRECRGQCFRPLFVALKLRVFNSRDLNPASRCCPEMDKKTMLSCVFSLQSPLWAKWRQRRIRGLEPATNGRETYPTTGTAAIFPPTQPFGLNFVVFCDPEAHFSEDKTSTIRSHFNPKMYIYKLYIYLPESPLFA